MTTTSIQPSAAVNRPSPVHAEPEPANLLAAASHGGYLGPATVVQLNERERLVLVQWERSGKPCLSWARPALVAAAQLQPGDVALVLSQNLEDFYLIGILSGQPPASAALKTPSGASVAVAKSAGEEVVQVHSRQGALVFEYHPESGRTLVNVATGDLEFVTHDGSISFQAAKNISLVAHRLETQAETVVAKAGNVYQSVEELTQLQTGRMRTLVKGSVHLQARDAFLKAEQDFKVDGEQIHLG